MLTKNSQRIAPKTNFEKQFAKATSQFRADPKK